MKALEEKICSEGKVFPGNVLKVNSFLNHQIDIPFLSEIGKAFYELYEDCGITKVLTIETSGIPPAVACAQFLDVPVVFAKKNKTSNVTDDCYVADIHSYTHGNDYQARIEKEFLNNKDIILIIDDFLANGCALEGLLDICRQAEAKVSGCGIVIEKAFQSGGERIRNKGVRVDSLAKIKKMDPDGLIEFE